MQNDASHKTSGGWPSIKKLAASQPSSFLSCTALACYRLTRQSQLGSLIYSRDRIPAGEILAAQDLCSETIDGEDLSESCLSRLCGRSKKEVKYLRCIDSIGQELMIPFDAKGDFHRVHDNAGSFDAHEAFQLQDAIDYLSLPTTVKLVYGETPSAGSDFTGVLRLEEEPFLEEVVIACTLGENPPTMLEIPIDSPLRLIPALNSKDMMTNALLQDALRYCSNNVDTYVMTIKVTQSVFPDHVTSSSREEKNDSPPRPRTPLPRLPARACTEEAAKRTVGNTGDGEENPDNSDHYTAVESDEFNSDPEEGEVVYETIPPKADPTSGTRPKEGLTTGRPTEDEDGYLVPLSIRNSEGAAQHDMAPEYNYAKSISIEGAAVKDPTSDAHVGKDAGKTVECLNDAAPGTHGSIIAYQTSNTGNGTRYVTNVSVTNTDDAATTTVGAVSNASSDFERVDHPGFSVSSAPADQCTDSVRVRLDAVESLNAASEVESIPEVFTYRPSSAGAESRDSVNSIPPELCPSEEQFHNTAVTAESSDVVDASSFGSAFDRFHGDFTSAGFDDPGMVLDFDLCPEPYGRQTTATEGLPETSTETGSSAAEAKPTSATTAVQDTSEDSVHFQPVQDKSAFASETSCAHPDIDFDPADTANQANAAFEIQNAASAFDNHALSVIRPTVIKGCELPADKFSSEATAEDPSTISEFEHTVNSIFSSAEIEGSCTEDTVVFHDAASTSVNVPNVSEQHPATLDAECLIQDANDVCFSESCGTDILNAATADALLKHRLANADSDRLDAFLDDSLQEYQRLSSASEDLEASNTVSGTSVTPEGANVHATTLTADYLSTETGVDTFLEKLFSRATTGEASPAMQRRVHRFHSLTTDTVSYLGSLPHQTPPARSLSQADFHIDRLQLADDELMNTDSGDWSDLIHCSPPRGW